MGLLSRPQMQVLLAAASSPDGATPLNENLSSGNAAATIGALMRSKLVVVSTRPDGSRWVVITEAGLRRVQNGAARRKKVSVDKAIQRVVGGSLGKLGPVAGCSREYAKPKRRPRGKMGVMTALLEREQGATLAELIEVTGWKAASVYGVLSSRFGPRWGKPLLRKTTDRGTTYWLVRKDEDAPAKAG